MAGFMKTAAFVLAATAVSKVSAQTFSDCNPMFNTTCTPNTALGTWHDWNFTDSTIADTKIWNTTGGTPDYTDVGAQFTVCITTVATGMHNSHTDFDRLAAKATALHSNPTSTSSSARSA